MIKPIGYFDVWYFVVYDEVNNIHLIQFNRKSLTIPLFRFVGECYASVRFKFSKRHVSAVTL